MVRLIDSVSHPAARRNVAGSSRGQGRLFVTRGVALVCLGLKLALDALAILHRGLGGVHMLAGKSRVLSSHALELSGCTVCFRRHVAGPDGRLRT